MKVLQEETEQSYGGSGGGGGSHLAVKAGTELKKGQSSHTRRVLYLRAKTEM